jgi:hypothetical protein
MYYSIMCIHTYIRTHARTQNFRSSNVSCLFLNFEFQDYFKGILLDCQKVHSFSIYTCTYAHAHICTHACTL